MNASDSSHEKPLSGMSRLALISGAAGTIFLFYLFVTLSLLFLVALVGLDLVLILAALRFGLAGAVARMMERHVAVLTVFVRSVRLHKAADLCLDLKPQDAPRLFSIVENLCQRLVIAPPNVISLEVDVNAWVRLKGYRRGAGKTILGIGYDLLAGLSEKEVEAVLAHEMAHAKLVQRGMSSWLKSGLARLVSLSNALYARVDMNRRARINSDMASAFLSIVDRLTRIAAHLVATYSRQDEFDADRGAAELCGAAAMRSALTKMDSLAEAAARLPWRERVAQLHAPEGFSRWLITELAAAPALGGDTAQVFNKYSTHPLLKDRLAALPPADALPAADSALGIGFLAEPDNVAEKLVSEIQRVWAEEEKKDSKALRKWSRKARSGGALRPLQVFALFIILAGIIAAVTALCIGAWGWFTVLLGFAVGGVFLYRVGRYKDRLWLCVPDYALLKESGRKKQPKDFEAVQKQVETTLRARFDTEKSKRKRALAYATDSFNSLERCDYLAAHVAARLCLEVDNKSVEGCLALAIAAAGLNNVQQSASAWHGVKGLSGFRTPSTVWGAAWVLVLLGDWAEAEALLEVAVKDRPNEPTLLLLLAFSQSRRGKLQSAIVTARQACTPKPKNKEHAKLFINLLLDSGYAREAQELIAQWESQAATDTELMLAQVRLHLMQRNFTQAEQCTELLNKRSMQPHMTVRLGYAYEAARKTDKAVALFERALQEAHYPEAHFALARIEATLRNKDVARHHYLKALDTTREVGESGAAAVALFNDVVRGMVALNEPQNGCRAWIATVCGGISPSILANQSFLIYATGRAQAEEYFRTIIGALHPGTPPLTSSSVVWREADAEQQPAGPVRPGLQLALS